ncbi:MAG: RNA-directed DNA polymerase, partial [Treponema sp.]|nr:RNA-directed DNA polymerase [Treponema sp.]
EVMLRSHVERTLALLFTIIDGYTSPLSTFSIKRGLPIGNLTSQFFANLYLSSLDHFVLEKLKPLAYIRYMDDFVMFDNSLLRLKNIFSCIKTYLHHVLNLSLKPETFGKTAHGLAFLGWLISSGSVKVTTKTHRRMKRTLNAINTKWLCGLMSDDEAIMRTLCVTSVRKLHM